MLHIILTTDMTSSIIIHIITTPLLLLTSVIILLLLLIIIHHHQHLHITRHIIHLLHIIIQQLHIITSQHQHHIITSQHQHHIIRHTLMYLLQLQCIIHHQHHSIPQHLHHTITIMNLVPPSQHLWTPSSDQWLHLLNQESHLRTISWNLRPSALILTSWFVNLESIYFYLIKILDLSGDTSNILNSDSRTQESEVRIIDEEHCE